MGRIFQRCNHSQTMGYWKVGILEFKDHEAVRNGNFVMRWPTGAKELSHAHATSAGTGESHLLASNVDCAWPENQTLPLTVYPPERAPCHETVLCVHGLGERSRRITHHMARGFARHGYRSAAITLPYHGTRTPTGYRPKDFFLYADRFRIRDYFENAVVDILTAIDFLKQADQTLHLFAFSLGGFFATIAAAFSPDVQKMILLVCGGNFYHITWGSVATKLLRQQYEADETCDAATCRVLHHSAFPAFCQQLTSPLVPLDSAPMACFEYDPVTYAPFVTQPVLMVNARFDLFIPRKATHALYNRFPDATLQWLPAGHLSSALFAGRMLNRSKAFLHEHKSTC